MTSSKIVPHLWFAEGAADAARFYASCFWNSHVDHVTPLPADTPSGPAGAVDVVEFTLCAQTFQAISAGMRFTFNPSISFIVNVDPLFFDRDLKRARAVFDALWAALADKGRVIMPLGAYPFCERYGWVADRYGVSWQLMLTDPDGEARPSAIIPTLLFTGDQAGRADEAADFYVSVFKHAQRGFTSRYPEGQGPRATEGAVQFCDFLLEGQWFAAMDSGDNDTHPFTEATSLIVMCEDQAEVDYYWSRLSAAPQAEQCGWLKDRFGVSWQIVPRVLDEMIRDADKTRARRVTEAMLDMKKLDVAKLERAFTART